MTDLEEALAIVKDKTMVLPGRRHLEALVKEMENMIKAPVKKCPVCSAGPVMILSECKACETIFVDGPQSTYNKNEALKARQ